MSVLNNPIDDDAVRTHSLRTFITKNIVSKGPTPAYIGFNDHSGTNDLQSASNGMYWDYHHINIECSALKISHNRTFVRGEFDWDLYGVNTIESKSALVFERCPKLPRDISAEFIYFNDYNREFGNHSLRAYNVKFNSYWDKGGMYDVDLDIKTLLFNDPPKFFKNITGSCEEITFRCYEFDEVPGLAAGLIQQALPKKNIKTLRDLRAYYNNPKKYPYVDPMKLFDIEAFIKNAGLDQLKNLHRIIVLDCGIRIAFNKPTDSWVASIERLN